jgi:hypothetical protein
MALRVAHRMARLTTTLTTILTTTLTMRMMSGSMKIQNLNDQETLKTILIGHRCQQINEFSQSKIIYRMHKTGSKHTINGSDQKTMLKKNVKKNVKKNLKKILLTLLENQAVVSLPIIFCTPI